MFRARGEGVSETGMWAYACGVIYSAWAQCTIGPLQTKWQSMAKCRLFDFAFELSLIFTLYKLFSRWSETTCILFLQCHQLVRSSVGIPVPPKFVVSVGCIAWNSWSGDRNKMPKLPWHGGWMYNRHLATRDPKLCAVFELPFAFHPPSAERCVVELVPKLQGRKLANKNQPLWNTVSTAFEHEQGLVLLLASASVVGCGGALLSQRHRHRRLQAGLRCSQQDRIVS